jgi:transcriptional regulator with XRE-family HTH domain
LCTLGDVRDPQALGAKVAELRHARGFTMAAASRIAGMSDAGWSNIENAKGRPSVPYIRAVADALGADRAELLDLAGFPDDAEIDRERAAHADLLRIVENVDRPVYDRIQDMAVAALTRAHAMGDGPWKDQTRDETVETRRLREAAEELLRQARARRT